MNILLTSVGRRSYLVEYFKEVLGSDGKVFVANSSSLSPAFKNADNFIKTPLIYDKSYIPFLLEYCKNNQIRIVISLFDIDLPILSRYKETFEKIGTTVIVSRPEVISICNDKWETYQFLRKNGFNAPQTFLFLKDAISAIKKNKIQYPVIVKPRWGMGSIGVFEAENEEELKIFFKKTKRAIFNSYLKYEAKEDKENCVLIQEKLIGQEYGLDIINNLDGEYQNTVVKLKYSMRSGETDCAITIKNKKLRIIGEKISQKLKHIANLDVDIFVVNNDIYVLEMNARFGGGYPFSHLAGVNLPQAIIKWYLNENICDDILVPKFNICGHKDIKIIELEYRQK